MKTVALLKKTTGLNNVSNPVTALLDESVTVELAEASNINIDAYGKIRRRDGYTATARTEASHSLFCDGGECLFVAGTILYKLNTDYTRTSVRTGLTSNAKMSYCQVASAIYYANGFENGYVKDGINHAWEAGNYVGPVTTKVFSNPPVGHLLEYTSARIYIATSYGIAYTEPFAYGWFHAASNFIPLRSKPNMLRAVDDGIYVGLDSQVIFLKGRNPAEFEYSVVANSPVVTGTDVKVSSDKFVGNDKVSLTVTSDVRAAMWMAYDGIYLGLKGGEVKNLTKSKLTYTATQSGCAVFKDNKYISLTL